MAPLTSLTAGHLIPYGGDQFTTVPAELAQDFQPGDRLVVLQTTGDLLHIGAAVAAEVDRAVDMAVGAFGAMGTIPDDAVTDFFRRFADRLASDERFAPVAAANAADVEVAAAAGRSTTRLVLSDRMRADMIDGLRGWAQVPAGRDRELRRIDHDGWSLTERSAGLGVVGFVFEGRPNVVADACGVLRGGNTVVFRIGSDALGTATALMDHLVEPSLVEAGLPPGAVSLIGSPARAAGHGLFSDARLALAVARGSGPAVDQLGAVARQAGLAVSLHGTGGAWMVTGTEADPGVLRSAVANSLDRKVCNSLNTCCVLRDRAFELVPEVLAGLSAAAKSRSAPAKLWVVDDATDVIPPDWLNRLVDVQRAEGPTREPQAERLGRDELGREWEWENSPEMTLVLVDDLAEAVALFNEQSPRFIASLISESAGEQDWFWDAVDAPFVGNGFTRWVDGQYALDTPELGLSNWSGGRLFARGAILSGDGVYTVRTRVEVTDSDVSR